MVQNFQVGTITSTHGLKGEVKVFPSTEDMRRFDDLKGKTVVLDPDTKNTELVIEGVKYFKNQVILKFKGLDRIEDVERLRKSEIFISREDAIPLEDGEYYIADIFGMKVWDEDDNFLGEITDVLQTGANDVYVVHADGRKDLLIPGIPPVVLDMNIEEGTMKIHLLEGLMDL